MDDRERKWGTFKLYAKMQGQWGDETGKGER